MNNRPSLLSFQTECDHYCNLITCRLFTIQTFIFSGGAFFFFIFSYFHISIKFRCMHKFHECPFNNNTLIYHKKEKQVSWKHTAHYIVGRREHFLTNSWPKHEWNLDLLYEWINSVVCVQMVLYISPAKGTVRTQRTRERFLSCVDAQVLVKIWLIPSLIWAMRAGEWLHSCMCSAVLY